MQERQNKLVLRINNLLMGRKMHGGDMGKQWDIKNKEPALLNTRKVNFVFSRAQD